jgi:hypothetical protein
MKTEILYKSALLVAAIAITTTLHEVVHLAVGRSLGIPARFLNYTSVGIPITDAIHYPPMRLAVMNAAAPVFSFFFFGLLPLWILAKKRMKVREPWLSLLGWSTVFNTPYLGLQLMLAVNISAANGSGSDMAAVMGAFAVPLGLRFLIGSLGYLVFIGSVLTVGRIFSGNSDIRLGSQNEFRKRAGYGCFLFGFLSVCCGDRLILSGNQKAGMAFLALGGFLLLAIGSILLISFGGSRYLEFKFQWFLPALVGTFFMALVGIFLKKDYANFWLILIPSALSIGAVMTGSPAPYREAPAHHRRSDGA